MNNWDDSVVELLESVRSNSTFLSEYHRKTFFSLKFMSVYFDIPVIVLSSFSASFSVGSQPYLEQGTISLVGCFIGFVITIITSTKLYLNIDDAKKLELDMSKDFYSLSIEINKMLTLKPEDRGEDGIAYLNKKYSNYQDLVRRSNLLCKKFKKDKLTHIELLQISGSSNGETSSDENDNHSPRNPNLTNIIVEQNL
tara:strand:- start:1275 stop:1865 length:591 start_codon:yes stop_codon:yes gene_type:complete